MIVLKIIKNNYQKTLGFTRCKSCDSVLCIQKTDVNYEFNGIKHALVFYCGACGHRQEFKLKELISEKKALGKGQNEFY